MMRIFMWLIPGGLAFGVAWALSLGFGPADLSENLVGTPPWLLLGIALFLAIYFHRSRVALACLGLGILHACFTQGVGQGAGPLLLVGVLSLLVGILSISNDRGLISASGLLRTGVLLFLSALVWVLTDTSI